MINPFRKRKWYEPTPDGYIKVWKYDPMLERVQTRWMLRSETGDPFAELDWDGIEGERAKQANHDGDFGYFGGPDLSGIWLFKHDFHALCAKGHKRNFIWIESAKPLVTVRSRCVICDKETTFTVQKYWEPIVRDVYKDPFA